MLPETTPETTSEATPGATSGAAAATAPGAPPAQVAEKENLILNNFPTTLKGQLNKALAEYNVGKPVQLTLAQFVALRLGEDVEIRAENNRLRLSLDQCETAFKALGNAPEEIAGLKADLQKYKQLAEERGQRADTAEFKLQQSKLSPSAFDALTSGMMAAMNRLLDRFEECAGPVSYHRDDLAAEFSTVAKAHFDTATLPA